jgi:hypothetical protein
MENKINKGAIFKNNKKSSEKHPDYIGSINADGKDMLISLWLNESKNGVKYFSVSLSEPRKESEPKVITRPMGNIESNFQEEAIRQMAEDDDDLPF